MNTKICRSVIFYFVGLINSLSHLRVEADKSTPNEKPKGPKVTDTVNLL